MRRAVGGADEEEEPDRVPTIQGDEAGHDFWPPLYILDTSLWHCASKKGSEDNLNKRT